MAANWSALRDYLATQADRVDLSWQELEDIVGGMPASSIDHQAWWSGDRPQTRAWQAAGYRVAERRPGVRVVFERMGAAVPPKGAVAVHEVSDRDTRETIAAPAASTDVVLISCVKEKFSEPAPARELYRSALFSKTRAHAEASGRPWFILSAEHGLVAPDEWLAPYDRYLPDTPAPYRRVWGEWVVARLELLIGALQGRTVEIHAGASYVDPLLEPLRARGASVELPLAGLTLGERLRWYSVEDADRGPEAETPSDVESVAEGLIDRLTDHEAALTPAELRASDPVPLRVPGLYSWWADADGAGQLSDGLGHAVSPGLIYAGLAGATRWPSGRPSTNTLWSRLVGMHLGKRARFSTFRLTLGSILTSHWGDEDIDEARLTAWMGEHLRVVPLPWPDPDRLKAIEHEVLKRLDPPLNLDGMERTDIRRRLTELRRGRR